MDQGAGGHAGQEGHHQQAAAMPGQHEVASSTIPSGSSQPQEPFSETLRCDYLETRQRFRQGQASQVDVTAALTAYTAQLELEREERRAQQHQGQGHTTYTRLLKEQLPAVAMGEASSNTQDHDFPPGALQAEGWPDCRADIRSWLSSNSGAQLDKQVLVTWAEGRYSPAYPEMSRGNEAEVNQDFDCAAFRLVSDCLQVVYPSQQWRWCLLPSLAAVQPDACLKNGTDGRVVAVYEGKHPEVFRHPSLLSFAGLPSSRRQGCETSAGKILRQTAGYSWALGTPYALIGTYEQIFCMQRTAPMKYRVSEGLRFMETDPSVREALYCISRKAIEEASWTPRDPPAAFDSSSSSRQVSKKAHGSDPGAGRGGGRAARGGGGTGGGRAPSTRSTCQDIGKNAGSLQRSLQSLSLDSLLSLTSRSCAWMGRFEGKTVVVKLVDGWKRMDEAARMDKEATVYGKLEHLQGVCVPRFVAVGPRDAGMQYGLVTEFVPGFHPKEGFQSNLSLMSLAEQALQAVHKAGVLHGDIEARNVLISPEQNSVCILDFGFARTVPPPSDKEAEEEMDLLRGLFGQSMSPQSGVVKHRLLIKPTLARIMVDFQDVILHTLWKFNEAFGQGRWHCPSRKATMEHAKEVWLAMQLPQFSVWASILAHTLPLHELVYTCFQEHGGFVMHTAPRLLRGVLRILDGFAHDAPTIFAPEFSLAEQLCADPQLRALQRAAERMYTSQLSATQQAQPAQPPTASPPQPRASMLTLTARNALPAIRVAAAAAAAEAAAVGGSGVEDDEDDEGQGVHVLHADGEGDELQPSTLDRQQQQQEAQAEEQGGGDEPELRPKKRQKKGWSRTDTTEAMVQRMQAIRRQEPAAIKPQQEGEAAAPGFAAGSRDLVSEEGEMSAGLQFCASIQRSSGLKVWTCPLAKHFSLERKRSCLASLGTRGASLLLAVRMATCRSLRQRTVACPVA